MPPPVVSVVGDSKSGKTTFIEKMVSELSSRGYRVATIKHVPQDMAFDKPDKDSWRHLEAGSQATLISSRDKMVLIRPTAFPVALADLARLLGDGDDIILAEGFKQDEAPKIEIHRREVGPPLAGLKKRVAIVTDEPLETRARQFALTDIKGVADLLERGFIKPQRERLSLYINNKPVVLAAFPRKIITNILLAIASSLKGVGRVASLEISLRKKTD